MVQQQSFVYFTGILSDLSTQSSAFVNQKEYVCDFKKYPTNPSLKGAMNLYLAPPSQYYVEPPFGTLS